jgi:hypothetical protein
MARKSHMVDRGDGVKINSNAPPRHFTKTGKLKSSSKKQIGSNWGKKI